MDEIEGSLLQRVKRKEEQQEGIRKSVLRFEAIMANDPSRLPKDKEPVSGVLENVGEATVIDKAYKRVADPEKIEEQKRKVAEIALRQLIGDRQQKVAGSASKVPLENRPPIIVHQEQRQVKKQEKLSRWRSFMKSVNNALGGNS